MTLFISYISPFVYIFPSIFFLYFFQWLMFTDLSPSLTNMHFLFFFNRMASLREPFVAFLLIFFSSFQFFLYSSNTFLLISFPHSFSLFLFIFFYFSFSCFPSPPLFFTSCVYLSHHKLIHIDLFPSFILTFYILFYFFPSLLQVYEPFVASCTP